MVAPKLANGAVASRTSSVGAAADDGGEEVSAHGAAKREPRAQPVDDVVLDQRTVGVRGHDRLDAAQLLLVQ